MGTIRALMGTVLALMGTVLAPMIKIRIPLVEEEAQLPLMIRLVPKKAHLSEALRRSLTCPICTVSRHVEATESMSRLATWAQLSIISVHTSRMLMATHHVSQFAVIIQAI